MPLRPLAAAGLAFGLAFAATYLRLETRPVTTEAGTAVRLSERELAETAGLVVEGRVLSAVPRLDGRGRVETVLRLAVERTHWGEPLAERTIALPGGVLPDGSGMWLAGMPRVAAGEEVLLFLSEPGPTGLRLPTGLAQGKLRVVRLAGGGKLLVRDAPVLGLVDPRTGGLASTDAGAGVLDYAAVQAEIAAGIGARKARGERPAPEPAPPADAPGGPR